MYNFELSVNKTRCCSCRDGAGEMFLTNVQQDQQDPLFYLCYLQYFLAYFMVTFFLLRIRQPSMQMFPFLRRSKK